MNISVASALVLIRCCVLLMGGLSHQLQTQWLTEQGVRAEEAQTHATQLVTTVSQYQAEAALLRQHAEAQLLQMRKQSDELVCVVEISIAVCDFIPEL